MHIKFGAAKIKNRNVKLSNSDQKMNYITSKLLKGEFK